MLLGSIRREKTACLLSGKEGMFFHFLLEFFGGFRGKFGGFGWDRMWRMFGGKKRKKKKKKL